MLVAIYTLRLRLSRGLGHITPKEALQKVSFAKDGEGVSVA